MAVIVYIKAMKETLSRKLDREEMSWTESIFEVERQREHSRAGILNV